MQSSMTVTARKGHPELAKAGIAPGDLVPLDLFCRLGHVVFSPQAHDGTQVDAALAALGRKRRIAMTMPYFSAVARIAADSDLLATLPTGLAARIGAKEGLCRYRLPLALPPIQIEMFWHPRHTEAPAHRWLRATLRDIAAPIDETPALHGTEPAAIPGAM